MVKKKILTEKDIIKIARHISPALVGMGMGGMIAGTVGTVAGGVTGLAIGEVWERKRAKELEKKILNKLKK